MSTSQLNRYPGIREFTEAETHLFFGRKLEARKLLSLVKAKSLVVLFAKSGIGKSSLLNAGLIPQLDQVLYQPVKIRLQDTGTTPVSLIKQSLQQFLNEEKLRIQAGTDFSGTRLWEFLRSCEFSENTETAVVPVIIFDQFEEFFDHPPDQQETLIAELADLLSQRLPERIRESIRRIPRSDRTQEQLDWHSPLSIKVIFAIRSDKLSLMDGISDRIPTILHNRFHLKPLGQQQAREAIVAPARLKDQAFVTPPFEYREDTLQMMLDYLKDKNDEVESFQLQLLCQHIEREVKKRHGRNP